MKIAKILVGGPVTAIPVEKQLERDLIEINCMLRCLCFGVESFFHSCSSVVSTS